MVDVRVSRTCLHIRVHSLTSLHQGDLILPELLKLRTQLTLRLLEDVSHNLLGGYCLVLEYLLIVVERTALIFVLFFIANQETIHGTDRNRPTTTAIEAYLTFKEHAGLLDA